MRRSKRKKLDAAMARLAALDLGSIPMPMSAHSLTQAISAIEARLHLELTMRTIQMVLTDVAGIPVVWDHRSRTLSVPQRVQKARSHDDPIVLNNAGAYAKVELLVREWLGPLADTVLLVPVDIDE